MIKFSIIIPCKKKTKYLTQCIKSIRNQSYDNYEIIVIPDKYERVVGARVIPLNKGPAEKRDYGVKMAKGDVIAFIDDDAYPHRDWLKNSLKYLKEYDGIGGPQITPRTDSFSQKLSGYVLSSMMIGGLRARYESIGNSFLIHDWPTVNFIIKKKAFLNVGGFDSDYYPGEDTKLCLDLINNDYKLVYAPDVIVYHHRRKGLKAHIKQISNYGLHRGYFVKRFPETSFKLTYFLPSLFSLLFIIGLIGSFFNSTIRVLFIYLMIIYSLISLIEGLRLSRNILYGLAMPFYVLITHLVYGINFIKGLLTRNL